MLELIPGFNCPSPKKLKTLMEGEFEGIYLKIVDIIKHCSKICLSADIGTTKGMRYSYLAIMAHVFIDCEAVSLALDIVYLEESHTADYVRQCFVDVIDKFKINPSKIFRVITDSGANMRAAFL